ncbi:glutaredoxin-related protein 5, mitochondrial-like isoform X2 [Vespa mandarinia]|uniref:glutaredoxin-related protein 5, mitochondrial-like isoform X2 n=2 Tax=Vespa TaxID=7443 RepID=UPI00161254C1|nr:glutaredoxin-related protein 5, mitochondrial-like isoform X2 [Vespa mandarinia]XP_046823637.1 glutaredoxin-related protein 5, mitochondrial isoform X1 [Vespa crabro]
MLNLGGRLTRIIIRNFATKSDEIGNLVKKNKVVVFMKGIPEEPRCGFSNAVVQIFRMHGVPYDAHDVLQDEELRQGIKEYSKWPTIPQVFINGDFIGGCDILLEMHKNGELVEELKKVGIKSALLEKENTSQSESTKSKDTMKAFGISPNFS